MNASKLTDEQRDSIDKQLTMSECFTALKTFKRNKTPGNDGLTVEFYLAFWPLVGKCLVECLNFAHRHGEFPGGDSHMEQTGMLVGNFEFNP